MEKPQFLQNSLSKTNQVLIGLTVIFCTLILVIILSGYMSEDSQLDEPHNQNELYAVGDDSFPPFSFLRDGTPTGYDVEIMQTIAQDLNRTVHIELMEWAEAVRQIEHGEKDILIGVAIIDERKNFFDFTERTINQRSARFMRRDDFNLPTQDLSRWNGTVAGQIGDMNTIRLKDAYPNLTIQEYPNQIQAMQAIINGSADLFIGNYYVGMYTLQSLQAQHLLKTVGDPESERPYGLAVKKGNTALLSELNQAIDRMKQSGEMKKIRDRWFGEAFFADTLMPYLITLLVLSGGAILVITVYSLILRQYNTQLNTEVAQQTITLQHQIEELDELKILLDAAFKQSNVPMILIHLPDEKIYTINQSALDILGINQDMINEGAGFSEVFTYPILNPDTREEIPKDKHPLILAAQGMSTTGYEGVMCDSTGSLRYLLINASPISGPDNRYIAAIMVCTDITERRQVLEAMNLINRKLNFLTKITRNEIQNLVFVLRGYLEFCSQETTEPHITQLLARMQATVHQLSVQISFTRNYQDMGMNPPKWQKIKEVYTFAASHVELSHITHIQNIGPYEVFADPFLEKALTNILANATTHGKTTTQITSWTEEQGGSLILIIADDGIGIEPERKELIFSHDTQDNQGLGLFFAREVLSITGLTIQETGTIGRGARFKITFPKGTYRIIQE
jgi:PAS domain S-box-containing protein